MNFKTLNWVWKLKRFFLDLSRIEISALISFVFGLKFSLNFDSRMHKTHKNVCSRDFDCWTMLLNPLSL